MQKQCQEIATLQDLAPHFDAHLIEIRILQILPSIPIFDLEIVIGTCIRLFWFKRKVMLKVSEKKTNGYYENLKF